MKDDKKDILVILGMFILLIFIILPPMFRAFFPKEENNSKEESTKMTGLTCTYKQEGNYNISTDILYIDNNLEYYVINYTYTGTIADNNDVSTITTEELSHNQEYTFFTSLNNISINKNNYDITITLDNQLLEDNPNNEELNKYYQDIDSLKDYLTSIEYDCNITD